MLEFSSRPHRLEAQDVALSRPKPGFEFPWGHDLFNALNPPALSTPLMGAGAKPGFEQRARLGIPVGA